MGVYIFKFLGDSGDGITWCKLGFHQTWDPWRRVLGTGFLGVELPTAKMVEGMHPDQLELLYWWPTLDETSERQIHRHFRLYRVGEWYPAQEISRVVTYVVETFPTCSGEDTLTITIPARNPYPVEPILDEVYVRRRETKLEKMEKVSEKKERKRQKQENRKNRNLKVQLLSKYVNWRRHYESRDVDGDNKIQKHTFVETTSFTVHHEKLFHWLGSCVGFGKLKTMIRLQTNIDSPLLDDTIACIQAVDKDNNSRDDIRRVVEQVEQCLAASRPVRRMTVSYDHNTRDQTVGHMHAFPPTMLVHLDDDSKSILQETHFHFYDGEWAVHGSPDDAIDDIRASLVDRLRQSLRATSVDDHVDRVLNDQ